MKEFKLFTYNKDLLPEGEYQSHNAGIDLRADIDAPVTLINTPTLIPTGVKAVIPEGYVLLLYQRSSLIKRNTSLSNCVGVIDSSYRGEIKVALTYQGHRGYEKAVIVPNERIAQLVLTKHYTPQMSVSELSKDEWSNVAETYSSDRGDGGFGSTGKD